MKKVVLTMVVTMLVMLVIGNGLGLVYLSYKCDKSEEEIGRLKLTLVAAGIQVSDDKGGSSSTKSSDKISIGSANEGEIVTIDEDATPEAEKVEKIEDNKEYKKYISQGIENIDSIVKELPNYYAVMALQELTACNIENVTDVKWEDDKELIESESKEVWDDFILELPRNIFDIMNSDKKIDSKINDVEEYGYLAYPIMKNINDNLKDGEEISYENCSIEYEFSLKEKKKIKDYLNDIELSDKEKNTLTDYIEYVAE